MKNLNQSVLLLALTTVIGCLPLQAKKPSVLKAQTFTSNEAGFLVNSHLITGEREAILVDAQFTRSQAKEVAKMVKNSGKDLKSIFITHGHPDHYFGLEILKREFPNAAILATAPVIADIQATAQGKLDYWKKIYGEELPDTFTVPSPLEGSALNLEGNEIQIIELMPGESEHANVLYIPSTKTLLGGDMVFNEVHLWLAEDRPEGWIKNLAKASELDSIQILPGHGAVAGKGLLDENRRYIETFLEITSKAKTKEEALAKLKASFPNHKLPIIAELSVAARVK